MRERGIKRESIPLEISGMQPLRALNSWTVRIALSLVAAACQTQTGGSPTATAPLSISPDLRVSRAPFESVEVNWKQRIDQPYVFLEVRGSYTAAGRCLERAFEAARAQGLEITGPPFALYYDDPGSVPVAELRMRACLPVERLAEPAAPLAFDVLESTTVAYAFVAGPYPEVPRAYPALFDYLARLDWTLAGPIRETYLQDPSRAGDLDQLVTEVQFPATSAR